MRYIVPVQFQVDADNAADAADKIQRRLDDQRIGDFNVYEAHAVDVSQVQVSDALKAFLNSEIQHNDYDLDGWETDLNYCLDSASEQGNDCPEPVQQELDALVASVGGDTKVASILGQS